MQFGEKSFDLAWAPMVLLNPSGLLRESSPVRELGRFPAVVSTSKLLPHKERQPRLQKRGVETKGGSMHVDKRQRKKRTAAGRRGAETDPPRRQTEGSATRNVAARGKGRRKLVS